MLLLKEIGVNGLSSQEMRATLQEIEILSRISHPNVIALRDSFGWRSYERNGQAIGIVTEYLAGGDLGSFIAARRAESKGRPIVPFPESKVVRWATQLGEALSYLHSTALLLHRDVKPANIFLSADKETAKLGDFGLSKLLAHTKDLAQTQVGTPLYMSPELCAGKEYDRGADLWALGCTLYETMSLQAPWHQYCNPDGSMAGGLMGLLRLIMTSEMDVGSLSKHFGPELCEFVGSLLSRKRKDRLVPMATLLARLRERRWQPPASWGLSEAATAALASMDEEEARRRAERGSAAPSNPTSRTNSRPASRPASRPISRPSSRPSSRPTSRPTSPRPMPLRSPASGVSPASLSPVNLSPTPTPARVESRTASPCTVSPCTVSPCSSSPCSSSPREATGTRAKDAAVTLRGGGDGGARGEIARACALAVEAHGAEYHAAAGVLQRSFLRRSSERRALAAATAAATAAQAASDATPVPSTAAAAATQQPLRHQDSSTLSAKPKAAARTPTAKAAPATCAAANKDWTSSPPRASPHTDVGTRCRRVPSSSSAVTRPSLLKKGTGSSSKSGGGKTRAPSPRQASPRRAPQRTPTRDSANKGSAL